MAGETGEKGEIPMQRVEALRAVTPGDDAIADDTGTWLEGERRGDGDRRLGTVRRLGPDRRRHSCEWRAQVGKERRFPIDRRRMPVVLGRRDRRGGADRRQSAAQRTT